MDHSAPRVPTQQLRGITQETLRNAAELIGAEIALAKEELLSTELGALKRSALALGLGVVLAHCGVLLLSVGLVLVLGGTVIAALGVGAALLVMGAGACALGTQFFDRPHMQRTRERVSRDVQVLLESMNE